MSLIRENGKIIYTNNKKSHVGPITLQFSEENFNHIYNLFNKNWVSYKNIHNFIKMYYNEIEEIELFVIYNISHSNLMNIVFYKDEDGDFNIKKNYK